MHPKKSGRRRGCILSIQGQHKLNIARTQVEQQNNFGDRYTYEQLCDHTGLSFNTIVKILKAEVPVDRYSIDRLFNAFGLVIERQDYTLPDVSNTLDNGQASTTSTLPVSIAQIDWGEAPDVSLFYGKQQELEQLKQWLTIDHCKLFALLGIGGIGKTTLVTKLTQQFLAEFELLIWRSLRNAPTLATLLSDLVPFLSKQQDTNPTLAKLLHCLKRSRCLIILDNVDTLLEAEPVGQFRAGFEDYEELLRLVAEVGHQSCVVLTSREKPAIVATLEGIELTVRSHRLEGSSEVAQAILQSKGLVGTPKQQQGLSDRYGNNPLALKIVATSIQTVFDGSIPDFLHEDTFVFNGIRRLFDQQFQRLSELEKSIMYWLAINRDWTSLAELHTDIVPAVSKGKLLESLEALSFRCLIEQQGTRFTQQPVVMEFVTEQLLDLAIHDLKQSSLNFLTTHALLKATAKDYIRETQRQLLVKPLCDRLFSQFQNQTAIVDQIQQHLTQLRRSVDTGYGAGNLINLLCYLKAEGDCLATWRDHSKMISSAQFNPDGTCIASISPDGFAKLWSVETRACLHTFEIDPPQGRALAFSPDGQWLALVSQGAIRLWDVNSARLVRSFLQNSNPYSLCFTPDGETLISNPDMARVQFWDVASGRHLKTLQGSLLTLETVALNVPQGTQLASGSEDGSVRLWDADSGECLTVLSAHTAKVSRLVYHPQQPMFASCSYDKTIKLWNQQGQCLRSLTGNELGVSAAVFHPDGSTLLNSDNGTTVRFWHTETGHLMETISLPASAIFIFDLALHPQGYCFATGTEDGIVRLWDYESKQLVRQFSGHQDRVWRLAFHPQKHWIASGGHDGKVNIWDVESGDCITTLEGLGNVMSVTFSPDGQLLAVSGDSPGDGTAEHIIQVWNTTTWHCLHTFTDHTDVVSSLAFHPVASSYILVSASYDETIRYWHLKSGECVKLLRPDRLYEGMDITAVTGFSEGQKVVLRQLGAIDRT